MILQALAALIPYLVGLRGRLIASVQSSSTGSPSSPNSSSSSTSTSSSSALAGSGGASTGSARPGSSSAVSAGSPGSDEEVRRTGPATAAGTGRTGTSEVKAGRRGIGGNDDDIPDYNEQFRDTGGDIQLLELVDTVLLKAYLLTDTSLVLPFLQQKNFCHVEEAQVPARL